MEKNVGLIPGRAFGLAQHLAADIHTVHLAEDLGQRVRHYN